MADCKNKDCGCRDGAISSPTSFSNDPSVCPPNSETCTELHDMACICYQGEDIYEFDIKKGDRLDEVLQKLVLGIRSASCATFEDDTVCQAPINLTIANLTATSFDLSWDGVDEALSYEVQFKEALSPTWLASPAVVAPNTSDTILGLNAGTVYDIRVSTLCNVGSCFSLNIRVKTLEL